MHGVWIYKKDEASYRSVMDAECGGPSILQEKDDKIQVDFCDAAMRDWVNAGYWYGFE